MVLNIKKKEHIIYQIRENFGTALSTVVASFKGVKSNAMNQLRKESRESGVCVKVIPNSLLRRAVMGTVYECLAKVFIGQSVLAFATKKANDSAQIFMKFSKDNESFKIKGAIFEGNFIGLDQIDLLSNLPNYKESISKLMFVLKISSVGNLMGVLQRLSK